MTQRFSRKTRFKFENRVTFDQGQRMQSGPKSGVPRVPGEERIIFSLQICSSSNAQIHNGDNDN